MTNFLWVALLGAVAALFFRQERLFERERALFVPQPPEKKEELPLKVCRKAVPTIEEQIINMALYNGEDQTGGEGE